MVHMAFYRARSGNLIDWLIAICTWSRFSHIEIVFDRGHRTLKNAFCFSASPQDGGTRYAFIDISDCTKWEVVPLPWLSEEAAIKFCDSQVKCKYDWFGVLAFVIPFLRPHKAKWFCSEVGTATVENQDYESPTPAHKMSPEDLLEWVITSPPQSAPIRART